VVKEDIRITESLGLALDAAVEVASKQGIERPLKFLVAIQPQPIQWTNDPEDPFWAVRLHRETKRLIETEGLDTVAAERKVRIFFRPDDGDLRTVKVWLVKRGEYGNWWEVLTTLYEHEQRNGVTVASEEQKPKPKTWLELYDERVRKAANEGMGCGQCINGRVQFSADAPSIPCGFCNGKLWKGGK
jgi:hypothetical protein